MASEDTFRVDAPERTPIYTVDRGLGRGGKKCRRQVNTDPGVACRQGVKIRAPLTYPKLRQARMHAVPLSVAGVSHRPLRSVTAAVRRQWLCH